MLEIKILAFCTNKTTYHNNKCCDFSACQYPGTGWLPILHILLKKNGYDFISGDVVLNDVQKGCLDPKQVYVIQEENAKHAKILIALGATPFLLYSWESPLYTSMFYDRLRWMATKFEHRMLFDFAFELFNSVQGKNHPMLFPSFDKASIMRPKPWHERKELVMIAANKTAKRKWYENKKFKEFLYHIYKFFSPVFRKSIFYELHSERIKCLLYFQDRVDLYGVLWNDLSNLTKSTRNTLAPLLKRKKPAYCDDKKKTLSEYKFCICSENVDYPGYLTEKIFDCFVVGVIPIYFGHESVFKYVPREAVIFWRDFETLEALDDHLTIIAETRALEMIEQGQIFLNSERGLQFSNEAFAKRVYNLFINSLYWDS